MSVSFLLFANLFGLVLALYALYLVVRVRLYVGYAVGWLILLALCLAALDLPFLWPLIRWVAGTPDTQQAWMILVLGGMSFLLVYFSVQLTILSKRSSDLARHLALKETGAESPDEASRLDGSTPAGPQTKSS